MMGAVGFRGDPIIKLPKTRGKLMNKFCMSIFATSFFVAGTSTISIKSASAFDVSSCANVQVPETLDLLKPVDPSLEACVPDLKKVSDLSSSVSSKINGALSSLSGAEIGNEGKYELSRVTYNIPGKEIKVEGLIRARHVFGEIKEQVPVTVTKYRKEQVPVTVTKYRKEQVPVVVEGVRHVKECAIPKPFGGCIKWVEFDVKVPVTRMVWKDIPYPAVEMQWKDIPYPAVEMRWKTVQPPPLSATCNFTYLYNFSSTESTPTLSCGQGGLGNLTLNASAIARVLNGEVPTLGSILTAVNTIPPGVTERLDDTYDQIRAQNTVTSRTIGSSSRTIAYFSSRSFVEWASAKNQGTTIAATVATGGALGSQLALELEEKLRSEFVFFAQEVAATGVEIGFEQFLELVKTGSLSLPGIRSAEFKVLNVPLNRTVCVAGTDTCNPPIPEIRLGFVIRLTTD
jgi:hypothetical protein